MARPKRTKNKFKRHWRERKQTYLSVCLVVGALTIVLWLANFLIVEESQHKQVVRAMTGTPDNRYKEALELAAEGDIKQARVAMGRLARLSESAERPLGYGKSHLWVAADKLSHFDPDFIWSFPGLDGAQGMKMRLPKDEKTLTIQRHLAHAVGLNPELKRAVVLWAATLVAQGERNQAVEVLMKAIAHPDKPHPDLHVPLAHILAMKGNDLELQQMAWHLFESLGKRVRYRGADITERISYTISTIILKKYENADIAVRMLEASLPSNRRQERDLMDAEAELLIKRIKALRMAYHYHKAIVGFMELGSNPTPPQYVQVVDELEQVVLMAPDCQPAIAALSHIAGKNTAQTSRVKGILEGVLTAAKIQGSQAQSQAQSQVNISLAKLSPKVQGSSRKFLEDAVSANPENGEAVLQLVRLLAADDEPDHQRIEKLVKQSLKTCAPQFRADLNHQLGEVHVNNENWNDAIIVLERSLAKATDKRRVHALLAEAYSAVGQAGMAEGHRKLAVLRDQ